MPTKNKRQLKKKKKRWKDLSYTNNLISQIRTYDDPILKEKCDPVLPEDNINEIILKLKKILNATKEGVGLAASQIGIKKNIFVIWPQREGPILSFVNSHIKWQSNIMVNYKEGCLSYPGFFVNIERPTEIELHYQDEQWHCHTQKFDGIKARIILHEFDHTQGICLVGDEYFK